MTSRRETAETIKQTRDLVDTLDRRLELIQTVLMIREPSSTVAADAYDGLRKQIVGSVQERMAHLSQLVQLAAAVEAGADSATLRSLIDGWMESAGLVRFTDQSSPEFDRLYEVVEDLGGEMIIIEPAYVDAITGRPIRLGRGRRAARTAGSASAAPPDAEAADHAPVDDTFGAVVAQSGTRLDDQPPAVIPRPSMDEG